MRNPDRIKIIMNRIAEIWAKYPDLRLGQLVENIRLADLDKRDLFYVEDYDLIRAIEKRYGNERYVDLPQLFMPSDLTYSDLRAYKKRCK